VTFLLACAAALSEVCIPSKRVAPAYPRPQPLRHGRW